MQLMCLKNENMRYIVFENTLFAVNSKTNCDSMAAVFSVKEKYNSNSIEIQINELLKDINDKDKLLTFGFFTIYCMNKYNIIIPPEIINYCIIYAFLLINCWLKCGNDITMNERIASRTIKEYDANSTVYGNQLVSSGKHEWKIKIIKCNTESICIGIGETTNYCNDCFTGKAKNNYNESSYGYGYGNNALKFGPFLVESFGEEYTNNDIITVHLDLNRRTIGFSKNDKFIGIAYENITATSYRLACILFLDEINSHLCIEMISYQQLK